MSAPGAGVRNGIPYAELPPELSGGWMRLARVFGPGAVMASVTVGTGKTIVFAMSARSTAPSRCSAVRRTSR